MPQKTEPDQQLQPRHSIAVVSRRTGLSQLVLRAWERRYEAVVPGRTETGRRLYTDRDLEKLSLLRLLTEAGHRIGDIAGQDIPALRSLVSEMTPASVVSSPLPAPVRPTGREDVAELLDEGLAAVADLDANRLESVLARASVALSRPSLRNALLRPLIEEIGRRWSDGTLRIAHEHMSSAVIRSFISTQTPLPTPVTGAPLLLVTTLSGQRHELGALLLATAVREAGWNALYLGPDLPAEEIAGAALKQGARGILLSMVYPQADPAAADQLRRLRHLVGDDLPLFVGGPAASSYAAVLAEIGAEQVSDEAELLARLKGVIHL